MANSTHPRLSAAHLDDLAIIVFRTPPGLDPANTHPELDQDTRARLRARLKLIGRHDWPANMKEDPALRRGYTLRQCFRLMTALLLLDAHVPPSIAIPIARNNELHFLRAVAPRLTSAQSRAADDSIAVILLGEFWEWIDPATSGATEPFRVRMVARSELSDLWSNDLDLGSAGQRLVIDMGGMAWTMWRWIRARDLMPEDALNELLTEVENTSSLPAYQAANERSKRR